MDFDKKTLAAIVLIGMILILIQSEFYQKRFMPPPPAPAKEAAQEIGDKEELLESLPRSTKAEEAPVAGGLETGQGESVNEFTGEVLVSDGEDITVETNLYRAVFSSKGAVIKSISLHDYQLHDKSPVQLIGQPGQGNLGLLFPIGGDTVDTSPYVFRPNKKAVSLTRAGEEAQVEFILDFGNDRRVTKVYTFYADRYSFDLSVTLNKMNGLVDGFSYFLAWRSGIASTEPDFALDMQVTKGFVMQGDTEEFDADEPVKSELFDNPTQWAAMKTKYFATAIIPRSGGQSVRFVGTQEDVGEKEPYKRYGFDLRMAFDQSKLKRDDYTIYLGPLNYDTVAGYNVGLEEMMDLGWAPFRPFGRFVLWSFGLLHEVIPNYGVVIIIFSFLIKILLFPLTRKSYQSMKEMQALQPLMQEMNEKYKDDPQRKQQETMALYKEYGINPLGGCIPMVLQMPLLIALFNVFRSTIELRAAPFAFWITDLSRPDTIATLPFQIPLYGDTVNILPLFMGVTMFIQQKMTMKDPKQKAMIYFMPVFFTLLFNSFPSGLNLYYSLFNVLSIAQEQLIPYKTRTAEDLKAKKKSPKTKRRRMKHDYRGRTY